MTNARAVGDWLDNTINHLGPLTGAVNLAGVIKTGRTIAETADEDWDAVMDVNVKGVFNCIRAQLQRMDCDASIVNASSTAGLRGYGSGAAYSTSKVCLSVRGLLHCTGEVRWWCIYVEMGTGK